VLAYVVCSRDIVRPLGPEGLRSRELRTGTLADNSANPFL